MKTKTSTRARGIEIGIAAGIVLPRPPVGHVVKAHPQYFDEVDRGVRDFEVRKDDREPRYETGDRLVLVEFDQMTNTHTGRSLTREIGHVGRGGVFPAGYCAFGLRYPGPCPPDVNMCGQVATKGYRG